MVVLLLWEKPFKKKNTNFINLPHGRFFYWKGVKIMKELKLTDRDWMVWRVLKQDKVKTDAKPSMNDNHVARTWGNLAVALLFGYKGKYRVLPDKKHTYEADYRHFGAEGPPGWNAPPWVVENIGKVVMETSYFPRHGKVVRPTTKR